MTHIVSTKLMTWKDILDSFTYKANVLVALDASGSMPLEDMESFLDNLEHTSAHTNSIVYWTTEVSTPTPICRLMETYPVSLTAGGTDIEKLILLINDSSYDRVVVLTDGCFTPCTIECKAELLFVMTKGGMTTKEFDNMWNSNSRTNKASIIEQTEEGV